MHFTGVLGFLTVASALVSASPAVQAKKPQFYLQAKGYKGPNSEYNDLYLSASHTGAGFNAPALFPEKSDADIFHLNNTRLVTRLGSQTPYELAFGEVEDLYALWGALTLNIGLGSTGFSVGPVNDLTNDNKHHTFAGWRVCNWVHGVPELYYDTEAGISENHIPKNCELVELKAVYV